MISVLILTYNEERNISACLDSVAWSDDVLVVDSFSTDSTMQLVARKGVRMIQNRFLNFAQQRNFGLENGKLKHDWVLHLDADELVTPALKDELERLANSAKYDAYRLASKMIFQGRWLKYAGMYPSYQVRFGRRDKLSFIQVGHGQREVLPPERIGTMRESLLHYSFGKGLQDWVDKHNRYSSAEAQYSLSEEGEAIDWVGLFCINDAMRRRRSFKRLSSRLPCRPLLRFCYMYLLRRGFLDGLPGYHYCRLLAIYEYLIVLKVRETEASFLNPVLRRRCDHNAGQHLENYDK